MKNEQIIEAMARLDGHVFNRTVLDHGTVQLSNGKGWWSAPNYPEDLNAVQLVIDGLDNQQLMQYVDTLPLVVKRGWGSHALATAAQKCEAILKATGKWEE